MENQNLELLKNSMNTVVCNNRTFVYFPNWFELVDGKLVEHSFAKLPKELIEAIENVRNSKTNRDDLKEVFFNPMKPSDVVELFKKGAI